MNGVLYLIASPLGDNSPSEVIPQLPLQLIGRITHYVVEDIRSARRYLSKAGLKGNIDTLSFYELSEHTSREEVEAYIDILRQGSDVAVISEAGLPAVADPGAMLVELAQNNDIEVVPTVGPSSLMMALMASGLNGQRFAFSGYLPVKTPERRAALKELERRSASLNETELFIETPYRNDSLLTDILSVCNPSTRLCIAADITLPTSYIKTKRVSQWKKSQPIIGKRPCVFLILS